MKVKVTWEGEGYIREIRARGLSNNVRRAVIVPWIGDVKDYYIRMFRTKGRIDGQDRGVHGFGPKWKKNTTWTESTKRRKGNPMLSDRGYQFGTMVRSLVTRVVAHRDESFTMEMTNRARSDGFDYPSHLHRPAKGKHRFTVRPVTASVLRIPTLPTPTFRMMTRPSTPVPRPHMYFQDRMIAAWANRMSNWLFDGRISKHPRRNGTGLRVPF